MNTNNKQTNNKQTIEHEEKVDNVYSLRQSQLTQMIGQINKTFKFKINELKNYAIILVIVLGVVSYFFYDTMKMIREEIRTTNSQIDVVLSQNTYMQKNMKALSGTVCYTCHNTSQMFLPKTTLKLEEFVRYVRGERFVTNSVMPVFTEKDISYDKLQHIWKELY